MDSMALPKNFFQKFNDDSDFRDTIQSFSKWRIDYAPTETPSLTEKQATILSIIEKIINRGRLTRLSKELEQKILKITSAVDDGEYDNDAAITSYKDYHEPNIPNEWHDGQKRYDLEDMTAEEYFYKKVFIDRIGADYAKDVLPQVFFSSLVIDKKDVDDSILSQRIDFLITHNKEAIAIEIDDPTHSNHKQKDEERDRVLDANGLKVYRVDVDDLVNNGPSLQELTDKLDEIYSNTIDSDKIYDSLIAIKLAHQFQLILVELVKHGKIGYGKKCKVFFDSKNIPNLDPKIQKQVLAVAIEDLRELSTNVAKIYKSEDSIFDGIEIDDKKPDIFISVNDNYDYDQSKIVYIQDISYPLALEQNRFPKISKQDVIADESALRFVLNYIFRFDNFRPNQIDGIKQTLMGEDSIVLLPTGSGKSIVYQLLSFILPGMVVVIDPITSLIEDQVDNLHRHGIDRAMGITANTKNKSYLQKALEAGQYNLVFMSPERLQIDSFRDSLKKFCTWSAVPVCAIDEAHCVSEWGHDFRTSYLNLANTCRKMLKTKDGNPSILALTGTASEAVLRDMERDLGISDKYVIRPDSFDRKEIEFVVIPALSSSKSTALQRIIEQELPAKFDMDFEDFYEPNGDLTMSGIIFCPHVNGKYGVIQVLNDMNSLGIDTKEYSGTKPKNAPMDDEQWGEHKSEIAKQYKDNTFPLLAATKSFGMGIDKPNIRYTIHYGLPQSIESYYQEAGRAGRDRQQAYSYVIVSNDFPEHNKRLLNPASSLDDLTKSMKEHGWNGDDVDRMLFFHTNSFGGIDGELEEAKQVLDDIGDLEYAKDVTIACFESNREKIEKVIYRLSILGLVRDYTIDYSANEFHVILNAFNRDNIVKSYGKYVRGYQDNDSYVREAEEMIEEIDEEDPQDFVLAAMDVLLREFVYKIIENSRRQAFSNLLDVTTRAAQISDEKERSKMVRDEILKFLGNTHVDIIKKISDNPDDLRQVKKIVDSLSRKKQDDLYAEVGRALEAYPQHPGLILTRTRIKLNSKEYEVLDTADSLAAIIGFGTQLYNISAGEIAKSIAETLDIIISIDGSSYIEILNYMMHDDRIEQYVKDAIIDEIPEKYRSIVLIDKLNSAFAQLNNYIGKDTLWTASK